MLFFYCGHFLPVWFCVSFVEDEIGCGGLGGSNWIYKWIRIIGSVRSLEVIVTTTAAVAAAVMNRDDEYLDQ